MFEPVKGSVSVTFAILMLSLRLVVSDDGAIVELANKSKYTGRSLASRGRPLETTSRITKAGVSTLTTPAARARGRLLFSVRFSLLYL